MAVASAQSIRLGGLRYDPINHELLDAAGTRLSLRAQSLAVLDVLVSRRNQTVTKDELMQSVWPGRVVTEDSIGQCIHDIRAVVGVEASRVLKTDSKRGYRLIVADDSPAPVATVDLLEDFRQVIRYTTTSDGVKLAYAISGNGPRLVRMPHWMTHLDWDWRSLVWGPWVRRHSRNNTLLRYDPRSMGLSDRGMLIKDLDEQVRDLKAVVDAAGFDRFPIMAGSGGAQLGVRFTAQYPDRVSKLVLMGGALQGSFRRDYDRPSTERWAAMTDILREGWGHDHPAFRNMITTMLFPHATAEQMASFNHLQRVSCSAEEALAHRDLTAYGDVTEDAKRIQCPTLIMHSPHDIMPPFEEGRRAAALIPNSRLVPFDVVGHAPLDNHPQFETVHRTIDEFLHSKEE